MIVYTPPHPPKTIPIVDLSGGFSPDLRERKKVAWEIHKACRETGFFYVSNHRVPQSLIEAQFDWTQRFFDLPLEAKMALDMKKSRTTAGYDPAGQQVLDNRQGEKAPPDLKESFYCGTEPREGASATRARPRSLEHEVWPASLPGFRVQMFAYRKAACALGDRLVSLIALSLELPELYFAPFYAMPSTTLRILRYPPHAAAAQPNQLGAGAHTDWGGITLLAQDQLGGLEVRNAADEWIQATPVPGTIVINLGDLMQRWTNGLYRSTLHRVKNNSAGRNRHSVALFYDPRRDAVIECLPSCTDAAHLPRYAAVTAAEHHSEMFERSYGYAPVS